MIQREELSKIGTKEQKKMLEPQVKLRSSWAFCAVFLKTFGPNFYAFKERRNRFPGYSKGFFVLFIFNVGGFRSMKHYLHFHNNLLTCTCVLTLRGDKLFLFCHAMPSELVPSFLCPYISGRDLFLLAGTFMFTTGIRTQ